MNPITLLMLLGGGFFVAKKLKEAQEAPAPEAVERVGMRQEPAPAAPAAYVAPVTPVRREPVPAAPATRARLPPNAFKQESIDFAKSVALLFLERNAAGIMRQRAGTTRPPGWEPGGSKWASSLIKIQSTPLAQQTTADSVTYKLSGFTATIPRWDNASQSWKIAHNHPLMPSMEVKATQDPSGAVRFQFRAGSSPWLDFPATGSAGGSTSSVSGSGAFAGVF